MQHPAVTSCLRFKSLSYTFTFPVKTGKSLLLLLLFYFWSLESFTAIITTDSSYWYTGVVESDASIAKVLSIFLYSHRVEL